ncbi:putative DNA-binding transcriptional regulator YafY [Desulfohalotomaculum tongense]|uniref:helix-turn-helix transcriptional regulator n=1 Tax=Desulforadius tongensis TaxID=1216062 RepID=UPI00195AEF47|nr:WYL domain-containing protein [Desulforadius tongensis]MBM7854024.1 putative DNA-binding transcriptional regulator YafY [Desulforadius tongensis]
MGNFNRTERLLNIIYTIQMRPGIQAKELAAIFGCHVRTIQRDIKQIKKLGFKIDSSTGAAGGFASRGEYYLRPLTFSGREAFAIFTAARILLEKKGFPYRDDLQAALDKVSAVISEKEQDFFHNIESKVSVLIDQLKDYAPWGDVFISINEAIFASHRLEMVYHSYSSNTVSRRLVDPYHVIFRNGCWYLVGYCHRRQEVRIFRIDRIKKLRVTAETFQLPEDFSIKDYFGSSWQIGKGEEVEVKVKFFPPVSRLIGESIWHPAQQIEKLPGDELIFTVKVEGTWEIKKWILGWGKYAEVLQPVELREEIGQELEEMLERYGCISRPR